MVRLVMENMNMGQLSYLLEFVYTGVTRFTEGHHQQVLEIFTELQVDFSVERFDTENKVETNQDEFIEVSDTAHDCIEYSESLEASVDYGRDVKGNIVQVLDTIENNENEAEIGEYLNQEETVGLLKKICDYCFLEFNTFVLLKRHVRDNHGIYYDKFLESYDLLKPFKCDYCSEKMKTFCKLKIHVKKVHENEWERFFSMNRNYECAKCEKKFFTQAEVRSHERNVHQYFKTKMLPNGKHESKRPISVNIDDGLPARNQRKCDICGQILSNAEKFTDHMNVHLRGDKPYSCGLCDFKCSRRKSLRKHSGLHLASDTSLLCNDCGNIFNCQFDLNKHRREIHNQRLLTSGHKKVKKLKQTVKVKGEYICDQCGQTFADQQKYKTHIKFSHVSEDDKYQCAHCPHKSLTPYGLKLHQALHFPPTLPCEKCGKLFHTKLYLNRHIKQKHADESEKTFQCAQCGKGFITRDSYEGHLNMHAGVKPVQCRYCDLRYQNRSNAIAHEKKAHKELYTRKAKSLGGVRVKDRMAGKEIIGLDKVSRDISVEEPDKDSIEIAEHSVFYLVNNA